MIWTFWGQRRFSPGDLFVSGAPGAFYDPSDLSTLFQDAAGTTPVTAVEQPVGLMLDKSRGLVLGPEAVSAAVLAFNPSAWNAGTGWTANGNGSATFIAGADQNLETTSVLTSGVTYRVTITVANLTAGSISVRIGNNSIGDATINANGSYTLIVNADGTSILFRSQSVSGTNPTISGLSVRPLPGAHATQSINAARPTLRARYNLLERTEEFNDAYWTKANVSITANAATAPDGTTTAEAHISTNGTFNREVQRGAIAVVSGAVYTFSVHLKYDASGAAPWVELTTVAGGARRTWVNTQTGAIGTTGHTSATATDVGNGWWRFSVTYTTGGTSEQIIVSSRSADGVPGSTTANGTAIQFYLWGAQLMHAADQTATGGAYQRVGAATDYATGGPFRPYLAFDGSDDSMSTAAIDFSGTDEMTVFAGVTKLSDAAQGSIIELTTDPTSVAGSVAINGPGSAAAANYVFRSGGTAFPSVNGGVTVAAPITNVVGLIADISADQLAARINGAQTNFTSADQGTGNFANASLFIGSRNNASLRYNGRIYSLIVLGRTATAAEITATESWVNSRTGAY